MTLVKSSLALAIAGSMLIALPALAAVNVDNVLFENGAPNVTVSAGSNVNAHVYITNDSANDVESLFVKFPSSGGQTQQGICYDVADQIGVSPVNGWIFDVSVKVPSNSGTWDMEVSTHGTNGDAADNICSTSADDTSSFTGRVTVTGGSSTGTGNTGSGNVLGGFSDLQAQINALKDLLAGLVTVVTNLASSNATPGYCAGLGSYTALNKGDSGDSVKTYQSFLIGNGFGIAAGATGYFGSQTQAAESAALKACKLG